MDGGKKELFFEYKSKEYGDSACNERLRRRAKIRIRPEEADFMKRNFAPLYKSDLELSKIPRSAQLRDVQLG